MIRAILLAAVLAGCASPATDRRPTSDGCEWAGPIEMPAALIDMALPMASTDQAVRAFLERLAAHNKSAAENCP